MEGVYGYLEILLVTDDAMKRRCCQLLSCDFMVYKVKPKVHVRALHWNLRFIFSF